MKINENKGSEKVVASRSVMRNYLIAGGTSLILFLLIFALVYTGIFQNADQAAALAINGYLGAAFTQLMVLATNYGREYFWTAIVAVMLIFGKRETKILAIELAVLFAAGIVVGEALKFAYYRDRPFLVMPSEIQLRVPTDSDSSFPSGHAIIVGIGAMFVAAKVKNKVAVALLVIESAVVCYSRVYLGAHFPSDVLGGLAVAGAIAFLGLFVIDGKLKKFIEALGGFFDKMFRTLHFPAVL